MSLTEWAEISKRAIDGSLAAIVNSVATSSSGVVVPQERALAAAAAAVATARRVCVIGNGGSMSIAQHIATDFVTQAGVDAEVPSDIVAITAEANDHGYEMSFAGSVARRLKDRDVLIAMSCSGRSQNVLRAAQIALAARVEVVTLSGFDETNPLRAAGMINFWVPSRSYGAVQIAHLAILHAVCDALHETSYHRGH